MKTFFLVVRQRGRVPLGGRVARQLPGGQRGARAGRAARGAGRAGQRARAAARLALRRRPVALRTCSTPAHLDIVFLRLVGKFTAHKYGTNYYI